ncbi:hypothetical protein ABPG73_018835 [Tetrahymena malaccensis]
MVLSIKIARKAKSHILDNQFIQMVTFDLIKPQELGDPYDENNFKQMAFEDVKKDTSQSKSPQSENNYQQIEQEDSESDEKTFNPPLKKYQKLNQLNQQTRQQIQLQSQMDIDDRDIQLKLNDETQVQSKQGLEQKRKIILKSNQIKIVKKSSTLESYQKSVKLSVDQFMVNQQNKKIILNNQQKRENSLCISREFCQNFEENNKMQQMLFLLFIQNNHLQQKLIEKEIFQKKGELFELEQKLSQLKQEKETYIRQPKLLNYQMLTNEQKIIFN